jgi:uncharacterized membrane protein YphA (DoxX/SURF4 family)
VACLVGAIRWRVLLLPAALGLGLLIVGDQHRYLPWTHQFLLCGWALALLPTGTGLVACRFIFAAIYVHSGLSKLDATFLDEVGSTFARAMAAPVGLEPDGWPAPLRVGFILGMPMGEVLAGLGLLAGRTRPYALAGVVLVHASVLVLLGPWGLDHSGNVLCWNGALIAENLALFGLDRRFPVVLEPLGWRQLAGLGALPLALLWPFGERVGVCDSWPGWALYASHAERSYVLVHADELPRLPANAVRGARPLRPGDPWHRLDLVAWSRAERGTPPYPQNRAVHGVVVWLARRVGPDALVRVVHWSRADRLSGRRSRFEANGAEALERAAGRFILNAHPD